jgi:uncharacterized OsmC-like protein
VIFIVQMQSRERESLSVRHTYTERERDTDTTQRINRTYELSGQLSQMSTTHIEI